MTKEMAIVLLGSKDVYLTEEGRQKLMDILKGVTSSGLQTNGKVR